MTRRFCDICGSPASECNTRLTTARLEVGEPHRSCREFEDQKKIVCTSITAALVLGFQDHPTGFGGPPDLCRPCVLKMVDLLRETLAKDLDR